MFTDGLKKLNFVPEDALPIYTDENNIKYIMFGESSEFRIRTRNTKEPETINWMKTFKRNSVFFDIGANIGIYSLYAAMQRNALVYSFEPSVFNNYVLTRNIMLNNLESKVVVCDIAVSPKTGLTFFSQNQSIGSGNNQIAVSGTNIIGCSSLKEILSSEIFEFPNYIKIDIDGLDFEVLEGAEDHLKDSRIKSVLIEVDESRSNYSNQVVNFMKHMSFPHVENRHYPDFDKNYYAPIYNYIFYR